jgi:hypothetical protein
MRVVLDTNMFVWASAIRPKAKFHRKTETGFRVGP